MILAGQFDALLFDLDGVVYVGPDAVPHAAEVIAEMRAQGIACVFVTNNAARPARVVADHLRALGIIAGDSDVVTSPQAAVSLLPSFVPDEAKVLVIGGAGIVEALEQRGYRPVSSLDEQPSAVMQGYSPDLGWRDLAEATYAVASGLPWIATNPDLTFPTARGIAPGNGAMLRVVSETTGRVPDAVAGKPEPPLLREAVRRTRAQRPLMVGDRLDTDIAAGHRAGMPSLLVLTGVTAVAEVLDAQPGERPDFMGADLRALTEDYPEVEVEPGRARCRVSRATLDGRRLVVTGDAIDGLRAAAALAWRSADAGAPVDADDAVAALTAGLRLAAGGE